MSIYRPSGGGSAGTGLSIVAYRVTAPWLEGTQDGGVPAVAGVNWYTRDAVSAWATGGGDYATALSSTLIYTPEAGWKTWDVTDFVRSWTDGSFVNNGLTLVPDASIPNVQFVSGDDTSQPGNTRRSFQ